MKFLLLSAALAACGSVAAQQSYVLGTAPGYQVTQYDVAIPGPSSFTLPGAAAWDPAGPDFYYYDSSTESVRRFDTTAGAPASTALFTVPNPVFGPYADSMAIDPFATSDIYLIESGAQVLHKARRSGPDSLDTSFGTGGLLTGPTLSFFPYDMKFDAFGRLLLIGSDFGTQLVGIFLVDKDTLDVTQIIDLGTPAGAPFSGPIAVSANGDLYVALPPATFDPTDPMRIARFSKTAIDGAVNSGGAQLATMSNATLVVDAGDGFPTAGSMLFRTENGSDVLYFAATHTGDVYRSNLSTRAYSVFAFGDVPPAGDVYYFTALAAESSTAPFRPYSGDTARMLISVAHRDGTFAVQGHGLCIVECADSPAAVASLEITHGASAVANGGAFRFQVELRDTGGMPVSAGAGVSVELLSGSGTLGGTTFRVATSGVAVFDDLVVTGASNSLRLRFSVVGGAAVADSSVINVVNQVPNNGNPGGDSSDGNGCVGAGTGHGWLALLAALAVLAAVGRLRRRHA